MSTSFTIALPRVEPEKLALLKRNVQKKELKSLEMIPEKSSKKRANDLLISEVIFKYQPWPTSSCMNYPEAVCNQYLVKEAADLTYDVTGYLEELVEEAALARHQKDSTALKKNKKKRNLLKKTILQAINVQTLIYLKGLKKNSTSERTKAETLNKAVALNWKDAIDRIAFAQALFHNGSKDQLSKDSIRRSRNFAITAEKSALVYEELAIACRQAEHQSKFV